MAMTAITDRDIYIEGPGTTYNFMASANVKAGQGLITVTGGDQNIVYVRSGSALVTEQDSFVGVAAETITAGNPVGVLGQGNLCWGVANSTHKFGEVVGIATDGEWALSGTSVKGHGVALTTPSSANGLFKVLITG